MAFLILTPNRDETSLARGIREQLPNVDVRIWPDIGSREEIDFALVWQPPCGALASLPALRTVCSLGAGVDALVEHPELSPDVTVCRLAGPGLAADMAAWLVATVIGHWRGFDQKARDQAGKRWKPEIPSRPPAIGLLGFGVMARAATAAFRAIDCPVTAWASRARAEGDVKVCTGREGLAEVAGASDALINLLPLTDQTRDLLDSDLFGRMRPGSLLINVGRGEHLVEQDLLDALEAGKPGHAVLDVFRTEPLPPEHPFWTHPRIRVSPHCAAVTRTEEAIHLAAETYRCIQRGQPPPGQVDRKRGY